jgi:hypothetical protein
MRSVFWFVIAILVGAFVAVWGVFSLALRCPAPNLQFSHPHGTEENSYNPAQYDNTTRKRNDFPDNPVIYFIETVPQNGQTNADTYNQEPQQWLTKFLCEIKMTDVVIAFFSYCLFISVIFQAIRADSTLRKIERPVVFPAWDDLVTDDEHRIGITFRIRNIGRSPAILKEIVVKFDQNSSLPKRPDYAGAQHVDFDWGLEPQTTKMPGTIFYSTTADRQYAYGYIRYVDIFGKRHKSGFGIRIFPERAGGDRGEAAGGEAYNSYT